MKSKIYTKTGDDGTTGLVGGTRVKKSEMRLEAYGTIDELNSWLGLIRSVTDDTEVKDLLYAVQSNLFICGSKLASDEKGKQISGNLNITREEILRLENAIDAFDMELDPLQSFILPGGSALVGYCHIARTVCRRAERRIVQLTETTEVDDVIIRYVNRLSDFLFVLSRKTGRDTGIAEVPWKPLEAKD